MSLSASQRMSFFRISSITHHEMTLHNCWRSCISNRGWSCFARPRLEYRYTGL